MTTDLDQRLSTLGDHLDAERTATKDYDQRLGASDDIGRPITARRLNQPSKIGRVLAAAAVVILIAGLAGAVVLQRQPADRPNDIAVSAATAAPGQAAGLEPADDEAAVDQTAKVTTGDCQVRVRVYNASPRAGIATALTGAIDLAIESSTRLQGKLLPPRNAPTWDGDVKVLVGSNATCLDLTELELPESATTLTGNLLESWSEIGLSNVDSTISDETSTTIIVVAGLQYVP